jgi:hypothetical protein
MSGIILMLRMLKPFLKVGLKVHGMSNPWEKTEKKGK